MQRPVTCLIDCGDFRASKKVRRGSFDAGHDHDKNTLPAMSLDERLARIRDNPKLQGMQQASIHLFCVPWPAKKKKKNWAVDC